MPHLQQLNDLELFDLVKTDHMGAFEELYNRHWKQIYSFACKRVKLKEVAEEIVQEFLTNLWANRKNIVIKSSFEGYAYNAIRNMVFNYLAKEARNYNYHQFITLFKAEHDNSTEDKVLARDLYDNLAKELGQLPSKCRSVFELSRIENKSNKEIAAELGISEKTVEGHLTRAIKRLRVSLNTVILLILLLLWQ